MQFSASSDYFCLSVPGIQWSSFFSYILNLHSSANSKNVPSLKANASILEMMLKMSIQTRKTYISGELEFKAFWIPV